MAENQVSKYVKERQNFPYTEEIGWSFSRYDDFSKCKRKYYFQRYQKYDLDHYNDIQRLKNLTSIPLEIGSLTHLICEALLTRLKKTQGEIDLPSLAAYTRSQANATAGKKAFSEVYYHQQPVIDIESSIVIPTLQAMMNLLQSARYQWILEEALVSKDDWYIEHTNGNYFGECRIENMKAYFKVDFMFPVEDELYILDWKTGKPNDKKYGIQLRGYAAWANSQFGTDVSKIKPIVSHMLPEYSETAIQVTDFDIDDLATRIRNQSEEMKSFCEIPETNVPKPKEMFPMTPHESFCSYCNFREICKRG